MWVIRVVLLLFAAFIVVVVASFVYLPWWQALLVIAWTMLAIWFGLKTAVRYWFRRIERVARAQFRLLGEALRGAEVVVHGVQLAAAPPDDYEPDPVQSERLQWYALDFTILPRQMATADPHWYVGDLALVAIEAPEVQSIDDDPPPGHRLWTVRLRDDRGWRAPDGPEMEGEQRLTCLVGVPPAWRAAKFRYHYEYFGRIDLPLVITNPTLSQT